MITMLSKKITPLGAAMSKQRIFFRSLVLLMGTLLLSVGAMAAGDGPELSWGNAPTNNSVVSSGAQISNQVRVYLNGSGGSCSRETSVQLTGSCYFGSDLNSLGMSDNGGCAGTSRESKGPVTMLPGNSARPSLLGCTIRLRGRKGDARVDESRYYKLQQKVTLNNPGAKNDVDPNNEAIGARYKIEASARTGDGLANTLTDTNFIQWTNETPQNCTIETEDINSAWIRNNPAKGGNKCRVTITVTGDGNIDGPISNTQEWDIINTRVPVLELITPPSTGVKPNFTYTSSLPSINNGVTIKATAGTEAGTGQGCAGLPRTAVAGLNTFAFNALTMGQTYTCTLEVKNDNGSGFIVLPAFTVSPSYEGPGGVGGADGQSGTVLWLKGGDWYKSGNNINTWHDRSGAGNDFLGVSSNENGSVSRPFTTLMAAYNAVALNGQPAGYYHFNVSTRAFKTYVDNRGYVLIASSLRGNTPGASGYPQVTDLALRSGRILSGATLAVLDVAEVRISSLGTGSNIIFDGYNKSSAAINKVKLFQTLPNKAETGGSSWTVTVGTDVFRGTVRTAGTGEGQTERSLSQEIYHSYSEGSGLHWIPSRPNETLTYDNNVVVSLDLWVRGATINDSPTEATFNGVPVAEFTGGQALINTKNIGIRSLFLVYKNTSGASWSTPIMTPNGIIYGAADQNGITSSSTSGNILNGANFANGVNILSGANKARPQNYEIFSHILNANMSENEWFLGRDRSFVDRGIDGGIAEVIITDNAVNKAQRIIIENYLAIKFGLTGNLSGDHGAARYTYNDYRYDMGGIGQADDTTQHMRSKASIVEIEGAASGNNTFMMWGHNNAPQAFQTVDVPTHELITSRLTRIWRVRNTGQSAVEMTIHLKEIAGFLSMCVNPENFFLIYGNSVSFASPTTKKAIGIYDSAKQTVTFSNLTLPNGSYFTIGVGGDAATYFVKQEATGTKNGSSWANACSLDGALNAPRMVGDVLKVAGGLYYPSSTFNITAPISILGGYAGVTENEIADPHLNKTIISGDTDRNDQVTDSEILYHREIQGNNLSRLFNIIGVTDSAVNLEGFTITGMSQFANHGSAVWQENAKVNYSNMRLVGNRARGLGGSLLVYGNQSEANITDSLFQGNASEHGGALAVHQSAKATIDNTDFIGNQALLLANQDLFLSGRALNFTKDTTVDLKNTAPTNNFTVELWAKVNHTIAIKPRDNTTVSGTNNDQRYVFSAGHGQNTGAAGMGLSIGTNGIQVFEHASGYMPAVAVYNSPIGTGWHHIAVVYSVVSGMPRAAIYLDGTLVHTGVSSAKNTVFAPSIMGATAAYQHPDGFVGIVDEVRIWNKSLTDTEIRNNYYNEIANPASVADLVGYWQFNNSVMDLSANAANSTVAAANYVSGSIPKTGEVARDRYEGGAIDISASAQVTVSNSRFSDNSVPSMTGLPNLRGRGGAISLSQGGNKVASTNRAQLNVSDTVFTNNSAYDGGGAIYAFPGFKSLIINNSQFTGNRALRTGNIYVGSGGAINAHGAMAATDGLVKITDSQFLNNAAAELGGAIYLVGQYGASEGGSTDSYLNFHVQKSFFKGNTGSHGGALFSWQFLGNAKHPLLVENSTFTQNSSASYGGAIAAVNGTQMTIKHATIYDNTTAGGGGGGGIYLRDAASRLSIINSILIDNKAPSIPASANFGHASGTVQLTEYNLLGINGVSGWNSASGIGTGSVIPAAGTQVNQVIVPTLVQRNGEKTPYFDLSNNGGSGSLAFNKIPMAKCLADDQRGHLRQIIDTFVRCDMGAYETIKTDTDGDGVIDALDNCPNHSNPADPITGLQADMDGDGVGDVCDPDMDGDGIPNELDFFPTINLHKDMPEGEFRTDTDGDGIPDECDQVCLNTGMHADPDIDGDGIPNDVDNCPYVTNADQSDVDNDGVGDACDPDMDGDGIVNEIDNCPAVFNPGQEMSGTNGLGDACNALFVSPVGKGLNDCSSWDNACAGGTGNELQLILDQAANASIAQVFLAKGIYRPNATLKAKPSMQIYGGFNGFTERYYYEAKPEDNITVITADTDANDIVDSNGITRTVAGQVGTNLATLIEAKDISQVSGFNGLVFTGASSGSALTVENSRVRLKDVRFVANKATGGNGGGAIRFVNSSKIVIDNVDFIANSTSNQGGAIRGAGTNSELTLTRTNFDSNQASGNGGAVYFDGVKVTASDNTFFSNTTSAGSGGAIALKDTEQFQLVDSTFNSNSSMASTSNEGGGALSISGTAAQMYIGTSQFIENTTNQDGGAIKILSNGVKAIQIVDSLFKANTAIVNGKKGGAIYISGGSVNNVNIGRSSFVTNKAAIAGAIFISGINNTLDVDATTFVDNQAIAGKAGAVTLEDNAKVNLNHVTMLQNKATGNGGAIQAASGKVHIKNSLLLANEAAAGKNINFAANTFVDDGYNLIGFNNQSGLNGNIATLNADSFVSQASSINTIIKPNLINYGGLYPSIALVKSSEARDAIPNGVSGCITGENQDERGFDRPDRVNANDTDQTGDIRKCDIGAFEFNDAYRLDCFEEDGLRPAGTGGMSFYFCPDGGKTTLPELADSFFGGHIGYWMLGLLAIAGVLRRRGRHYA